MHGLACLVGVQEQNNSYAGGITGYCQLTRQILVILVKGRTTKVLNLATYVD